MPFDHHVDRQIRLLCLQNQGLDIALAVEPHLLAALVSRRLDARVRANAIALILHRNDIATAKALLRLQPFVEKVELEAIGLEFDGFDCEANFNRAIASFMPKDPSDQRRMLALLAMTVPRAGERAGLWFAQLFQRLGYELKPASVALLCLFIWLSQHPETKAGQLIHRAWDFSATLRETATEARTLGRWLVMGLLAGDQGVPAWLPNCRVHGMEIASLGSAAQVRELAVLFDARLYASFAEKLHADTASVFVARRVKERDIVGYIEIAPLRGRDYLYPADIKWRPEMSLAVRLPAAAYHLLGLAHQRANGSQPRPPRAIPDAETLAARWDEFVGPYLAAVGPGHLFPAQADADTIHRLVEAIDELGSVATGPRQE